MHLLGRFNNLMSDASCDNGNSRCLKTNYLSESVLSEIISKLVKHVTYPVLNMMT